MIQINIIWNCMINDNWNSCKVSDCMSKSKDNILGFMLNGFDVIPNVAKFIIFAIILAAGYIYFM